MLNRKQQSVHVWIHSRRAKGSLLNISRALLPSCCHDMLSTQLTIDTHMQHHQETVY